MSRSKISIFLKNIRPYTKFGNTAVYSLFSEWFPRDEEDIYYVVSLLLRMCICWNCHCYEMCVPLIEHYLGWEPVFYIFGSLGFVWAALFAIYGGSSPQDLCYDVR